MQGYTVVRGGRRKSVGPKNALKLEFQLSEAEKVSRYRYY